VAVVTATVVEDPTPGRDPEAVTDVATADAGPQPLNAPDPRRHHKGLPPTEVAVVSVEDPTKVDPSVADRNSAASHVRSRERAPVLAQAQSAVRRGNPQDHDPETRMRADQQAGLGVRRERRMTDRKEG